MKRVSIILGILTIFQSCNLFDNKEKLAKENLVQLISNQSEGAISLIKFTKTNGLEKNQLGEIFYVLEWEATIEVNQDIWKGGDAIGGYWNNFNVMKNKPDFWGSFLQGEPILYVKGTSILLNGLSKFEKTENGWRIVETLVKKSKKISEDNQVKASNNTSISQFSDQFTGNWVENTSDPRFVKRILKISGTSKNQYSIAFYSEGLDSKEGPWKGSFRKSDETTLWSENMELISPDDPPGLTNTYKATIFLKDDILFFKYLNGYECQLKKQ